MRKIEGSSSFIANTAAIIADSFSHPSTRSIIALPPEAPVKVAKPTMAFDQALRKRPPISLPPTYKWALVLVTLLTVAAGGAAIWMAAVWTEPTQMQQSVFDAMGTAWKMGFGALVGLLGGKQITDD